MQTGNKQNVARMKRSVIRDMQCIFPDSGLTACIRATRGVHQ
jgi:DeoR/GlpR family transcriptional regulator of sugar metabolism